MKKILGYLKDYYKYLDKRIFSLSALFMSILIFINYYHNLNSLIELLNPWKQFVCWYLVFFIVFVSPYFLAHIFTKKPFFTIPGFIALLCIAPALFAWKMTYEPKFYFTSDSILNAYWYHVAYWPFKLLILAGALFIIWRLFNRTQPFYGMQFNNFKAKPYCLMLLFMIPLIAAAATQPDFLLVYPKFQKVLFLSQPQSNGWHKLLYELSYGSDFISIELFFRGFLILAFARFAGKDAILPMALFYCTIHFGKPLGECISSFFGGIILGVITFHTQSIWGGLMVHLGIAWMMELAGYVAIHTLI